jgi:hypothetical protein
MRNANPTPVRAGLSRPSQVLASGPCLAGGTHLLLRHWLDVGDMQNAAHLINRSVYLNFPAFVLFCSFLIIELVGHPVCLQYAAAVEGNHGPGIQVLAWALGSVVGGLIIPGPRGLRRTGLCRARLGWRWASLGGSGIRICLLLLRKRQARQGRCQCQSGDAESVRGRSPLPLLG